MPENPEPAAPAPLARNRRRYPTPERPVDATALQQLAVLADGVKVLANQITGETDETAENEADRASRRKRKIQRFGVADDRRFEPATAEDASDPAAVAGDPDATGGHAQGRRREEQKHRVASSAARRPGTLAGPRAAPPSHDPSLADPHGSAIWSC